MNNTNAMRYEIILNGAPIGRVKQINDGSWMLALARSNGIDRVFRFASFDAAYASAFRRKPKAAMVVKC